MTTAQNRIQEWLDGPYDEATKREIRARLEEDPKGLEEAFFQYLSFGTGGLRAKMGIGTNRLNLYTVQMATQGLANYLKQSGQDELSVFIGYDVRHNSRLFAWASARVLAGNQIRVKVTKEICPTPLASFGCRHFHCSAAIMITASHNPPEYNGYKVYGSDGGQVAPPCDSQIMEEINQIHSLSQVSLALEDSQWIEEIGEELDEAYLRELQKQRLWQERTPLHIIYTPLHGTGIRIIPTALKRAGFSCTLVEKQQSPDGNFPHAASVNPEEREAFELGANMLLDQGADLLLGTDPDADRVGAAVLHQGECAFLTGNQIACLCLDYIGQMLGNNIPPSSTCIKTIVTTELFRKIAESYGASCIDVLTGFKYIAAQIAKWEKTEAKRHYLFGGEESYGYLFGTFVRDKDAISSSCLIAEAAAAAKREGLTLVDKIHALYKRYGVHRESLTTISLSEDQKGLETVRTLMQGLRISPPSHIGGLCVQKIDDYLAGANSGLPPSNVLGFWLEEETKLVIRPSGTEPKIKIYAETVNHHPDIERAICASDDRLQQIVQSFKSSLC